MRIDLDAIIEENKTQELKDGSSRNVAIRSFLRFFSYEKYLGKRVV